VRGTARGINYGVVTIGRGWGNIDAVVALVIAYWCCYFYRYSGAACGEKGLWEKDMRLRWCITIEGNRVEGNKFMMIRVGRVDRLKNRLR
jgi:hypothetical protein